MSLLKTIEADLKAAMKAVDKPRLSVLRMIKAALKNREIDKMSDLTVDEETAILSTLAKQRRESIEQFAKAGRDELAQGEEAELHVIQEYMPKQLSVEEVESLVRDAVAESGAKTQAEIGKVMKILMPKVKGLADGKLVNEKVKELLTT